LDFFLVLSRLEFALKLTGYLTADKKGVKPDWDRFATTIKKTFDSESNEELSIAIQYYLGFPPQKQIFKNGKLDWATSPPKNSSEIERAIILIRRVRNNLFHGGKYNQQAHDETARNEELLKMGITILKEAMRHEPNVLKAYEGAAI